jgi:hypothetical protein
MAKEGGETAALAEQQSDVVNFVDAAISDVAASGGSQLQENLGACGLGDCTRKPGRDAYGLGVCARGCRDPSEL